MSGHSLRKLATELSLSAATISAALRGRPNVKSSTRLRVLQAAEQMGYRHNPLASALMTEMRRSRGGVFRGLLAILQGDPSASPADSRQDAEIVAGAMHRAGELGFKIDEFSPGRTGVELRRIPEILDARGIAGVFVLPTFDEARLREIDWRRFSGVCAAPPAGTPRLHTVCADQHGALFTALRHLRALGYERPGLVLHARPGSPSPHRWIAAYQTFFLDPQNSPAPSLPLVLEHPEPAGFARWFAQGRHDVILADDPAVIDWIARTETDPARRPKFCSLRLDAESPPCAGMDLRPRCIGRRGIELLIEQVLRNERGEPEVPTTTMVSAVWRNGFALERFQ